jgi:hypothetical protein
VRWLWTGGKALDHVWEILLDGSFIVGVHENGIARGLLAGFFVLCRLTNTPHGLSRRAGGYMAGRGKI